VEKGKVLIAEAERIAAAVAAAMASALQVIVEEKDKTKATLCRAA